MPRRTRPLLFLPVVLLLAWGARAEDPVSQSLLIRITGIRDSKGSIQIGLWKGKKGFPSKSKKMFRGDSVDAKKGALSVNARFDDLPPGEYAVAVYHDENGNKKLDKTWYGLPKEGYGFSTESGGIIRRPSYRKSKFEIAPGESKDLVIWLYYRK